MRDLPAPRENIEGSQLGRVLLQMKLGFMYEKQFLSGIAQKRGGGGALANCPAVLLSYFHCGFVIKYKDHNEQYNSAE